MSTSGREAEASAHHRVTGARKTATSRRESRTGASLLAEAPPPPQAAALGLQGSHGNRYVQRLVARAKQSDDEAEVAPEVEEAIDGSAAAVRPWIAPSAPRWRPSSLPSSAPSAITLPGTQRVDRPGESRTGSTWQLVIGQGQSSSVQRVIEVRPPGRGEASAFHRRQELIDRLNRQSSAIQYRVDGNVVRYNVVTEASLTSFDRQMRGFIDRAEVVPLRLITRAGLIGGDPVFVDTFVGAYLDLDDMLASDDLSFRLNLLHLLVERFRVRNYERRIGSPGLGAEFNRAHRGGLEAEADYLRSVIGDPTIRFHSSRVTGSRREVFVFLSREGYRVLHVFPAPEAVQGGEVFVLTTDNRRLTIDQLRAERAAAAPAPGPR